MSQEILIRTEGNGNAKVLERKIFELKDDFSKQGVEINRELKKSLEFGAVGTGTLILTLCGWIAVPLITKLINKLFENKEDSKNVNIQINIKEINMTYNLLEDKQKILDYYENKDKND